MNPIFEFFLTLKYSLVILLPCILTLDEDVQLLSEVLKANKLCDKKDVQIMFYRTVWILYYR